MIKRFIKHLWRSEGGIRFVAWIIARYMKLVFATTRWQFVNEHFPQAYWNKNQPFIGCFWHGRMAMMTFAWRSKNPFYMLISSHPDGRLISKSIAYYGIQTVVGSSSKGGSQALKSIVRLLKQGGTIGITPDGPRGPCFKVRSGIIHMARLAAVDILPVTFATTRCKIWKSWDQFCVPFPFGRGVIIWGDPISHTLLTTPEAQSQTQQRLEDSLNTLTLKAQDLCGQAADQQVQLC